jgi:hypothetical protein
LKPIDAQVPVTLGFSFSGSFSVSFSASFGVATEGVTTGGVGAVMGNRAGAFGASAFFVGSVSFDSWTRLEIALKAPAVTPAVARAPKAAGATEIAADTTELDVNDSLRSWRLSDFIIALSVEMGVVLGIAGPGRSALQNRQVEEVFLVRCSQFGHLHESRETGSEGAEAPHFNASSILGL